MSKTSLRQKYISLRQGLERATAQQASLDIQSFFQQQFPHYQDKHIFAYYPINGEVDTLPLLEKIREQGGHIYLPHVSKKTQPLQFKEWQKGDDLVKGRYQIVEPKHDVVTNVQPNYILTPLVAYSRKGNRLGYGGGYYDRTLKILREKGEAEVIGLAYQCQECDNIPDEPHDQLLDWVITEKKIYKIG